MLSRSQQSSKVDLLLRCFTIGARFHLYSSIPFLGEKTFSILFYLILKSTQYILKRTLTLLTCVLVQSSFILVAGKENFYEVKQHKLVNGLKSVYLGMQYIQKQSLLQCCYVTYLFVLYFLQVLFWFFPRFYKTCLHVSYSFKQQQNSFLCCFFNFFLLLPCLSLLPIPLLLNLLNHEILFNSGSFYITFITLWFLVSLTVVSFIFILLFIELTGTSVNIIAKSKGNFSHFFLLEVSSISY